MAAFKNHFFGGLLGGSVLAVIGWYQSHINLYEAGAVTILGTLGGLLPDLDSDTGKPLEFLFQMLGVMIPMLLYPHFRMYMGGELTIMLLFFTIVYFWVRYLLCPLIKKLTRHRGIMHSIPFAVLCGQLTFLIFSKSPQKVAIYCAIAISSGAFIHLFMDEFHSITFEGITPRFNRASCTALTLYSKSLWATLTVYLLLLLTTWMIFGHGINFAELVAFLKGESRLPSL